MALAMNLRHVWTKQILAKVMLPSARDYPSDRGRAQRPPFLPDFFIVQRARIYGPLGHVSPEPIHSSSPDTLDPALINLNNYFCHATEFRSIMIILSGNAKHLLTEGRCVAAQAHSHTRT